MSSADQSTALYRLYGHLLLEADELQAQARRLSSAAAVLRWRGRAGTAARRRLEELAGTARLAADRVLDAAEEVYRHAASVRALAEQPPRPVGTGPR